MKSILIIAPFPKGNKGLNGQSIANMTLYEGLKNKYKLNCINTLKDFEFSNKKDQGTFKLIKFIKILFHLIYEIFKVIFIKFDVMYITPGQSYLGFMRFSPYMYIAILKRKPVYIHIHGGNFRNMYEELNDSKKSKIFYFLKRIKGAIVLGDSLKKMFSNLVEEEKVFVCENGVQNEFIATVDEINTKEEKINKNKTEILFLSNLMKEKGILEVLEVSNKFTKEQVIFNIAGAIEPEIKDKVEKYFKNHPEKIVYHGIVSGEKKRKLLLNSDIFVLPTYYSNEGQPISILEAYANGCSVITTNQGGIKDIFKDDANGALCESKNAESIYLALEKIWKNDKNFIRYNYNCVLAKYTGKKFVERIENILIQGVK